MLDRQSVVLTAERRMGKTSILWKMVGEPPRDGVFLFQDLESVHSELEFAEKVLHGVHEHLSKGRRTLVQLKQLVADLDGAEIGGVIKLPAKAAPQWKRVLEGAIENLLASNEGPVVLFWDEMPFMLCNIKQRSGEAAAMQVLDGLRALRQTHPRLRMVFTGSIGLHNVVTSLRRAGHANDATNDMLVQEVPPLAPDDAEDLARRLLAGERVDTDLSAIAAAVARETDGMPFFIHHVVDALTQHERPIDAALVRDVVTSRLTEAMDPWHLRHYRDRLDTYYSVAERDLSLAVLDALAGDDAPLTQSQLLDRVRLHAAGADDEAVRHVVVLLQQDHYVVQDADGVYHFRFPLIRRFWRLHRGLGA